MDWQARQVGLRVGGHRGASAAAPENTYAAFDAAIAEGAAFTETDVRLSSDGQLVLVHDPTLDRTTDGRGPVASLTLSELQALDAGSWFGPAFAGERVPVLTDFLGWLEGRAPFGAALEIKAAGIGARVAELAWASTTRVNLAIYAFGDDEIRAAKAARPDIPCVLLLHMTDDPDAVIGRIEASGADGADVPWQWQSDGLVDRMRERGLLIGGGSDEGGTTARELLHLGVDIIDTDTPRALIEAAAAIGADARH
jgi:glycerophosphoryl diester phosphodiesterase